MYDPVIKGKRLEFGVSGLLYESTAVLYDRASDGLWPQLTATAISGRFEGHKLDTLPFSDTTWGHWRTEHPETLVLSTETGYGRRYGLPAYATADVPKTDDDRLQAGAEVWGVVVNGIAKAYPQAVLSHGPGEFTDHIAEAALHIRSYSGGNSVSILNAQGTQVPVTRLRWFAWAALHPETHIYELP